MILKGWRSTSNSDHSHRSRPGERASIFAQLPSASGDRVVRVPGDGAPIHAARGPVCARVALAAHDQAIIAAFSAEGLHREGKVSIKSNDAILVVAIVPRVVEALQAIAALLTACSVND